MPPSNLLVVIGATGTQGGSVARLFAHDADWNVRGLTRKPSGPSATVLREAGVEVMAADLADPASLDRAFAGATAIFGVTDFWQFLQDPSTFAAATERGVSPNEIALEREVQQGKNLIDAAARCGGTLKRFVLSTLSATRKWSEGRIVWNLHFDGKAIFTQYLKDTYPDLAARTTYLQMGWYMSNYKMSPKFPPHRRDDGSFVFRRTKGMGYEPLPYVNPPHDTGYFVQALLEAPPGSTMLGYCKLMTLAEYADLWGQTKGVKCSVVEVDDIKDEKVPEWLALEIGANQKYVTNWGWAGGDPEIKSPEQLGVDMSLLTNIEKWTREEDYGDFAKL